MCLSASPVLSAAGAVDVTKEMLGFLELPGQLAACLDFDCEMIDGLVSTVATVLSVIKNGDIAGVLDIVQSLLPERCQLGSFELDYCLGYAIGSLVIASVGAGQHNYPSLML